MGARTASGAASPRPPPPPKGTSPGPRRAADGASIRVVRDGTLRNGCPNCERGRFIVPETHGQVTFPTIYLTKKLIADGSIEFWDTRTPLIREVKEKMIDF